MGWTRERITEVARRTGYPVVEAWSGHNQGTMGVVYGPMLHHTGTPVSAPGDYPTLRIVRDGRPDLPNSLCMYGLGRSGTIYLINDKISWHAGAGNWNGVTDGNGHFAGIEGESSGGGEWTPAQVDAYERLVASILLEAGRNTDWMPRHANFALPPGRKSDTAGLDMNAFRAKVAGYLANPGSITKNGDDDLPSVQEVWQYPIGLRDANGQLTGEARSAELILADVRGFADRAVAAIVNAILDASIDRTDQGKPPTTLRAQLAWEDAHVDAIIATVKAQLRP